MAPKACKSFKVKILTSNSYGLKILQTIFAAPAPVKAFRGMGGGGTPQFGEFRRQRGAEKALRGPLFRIYLQAVIHRLNRRLTPVGRRSVHHPKSCFAILQYKAIDSASCCFSMYSPSVCAT